MRDPRFGPNKFDHGEPRQWDGQLFITLRLLLNNASIVMYDIILVYCLNLNNGKNIVMLLSILLPVSITYSKALSIDSNTQSLLIYKLIAINFLHCSLPASSLWLK